MGNRRKKAFPSVDDLIRSIENSLLNIKTRTNGEFSQSNFHSHLLALPCEKENQNIKKKDQFNYDNVNGSQKLPTKKAEPQGIDFADSDEVTGDSTGDIFTIGISESAFSVVNSSSFLI
jgi:hypothetical protein